MIEPGLASPPDDMDAPISVLIIDDEELLVKSCGHILSSDGFTVYTEGRGRLGLEAFRRHSFDIVLTDLMLPDMDGLQVLRECRKLKPDTLVIMITGFATVDSSVEAIRLGAYDYVPKPFTATQLRILVGRAARLALQIRRKRLLKDELSVASFSKIVPSMGSAVEDSLLEQLRKALLQNDLLQKETEALKAELRRRDGRTEGPPADPEIYRVLLLYMLHDLRNAMESIRISASLLREGQLPAEYLFETYQGISAAAERAATLVQRVFTYIDDAPVLAEAVDVGTLVREVAGEVRNELPSNVRLTFPRREKDTPRVRANPFFLQLVLYEILRNAIHALAPTGGTIRLRMHNDLEHVRITVTDNGPGIPPHVLEHLEAVQSRRSRNLGSGLPLSLRLLEAMGGDLAVDSAPGRTTTVTISLSKAIG